MDDEASMGSFNDDMDDEADDDDDREKMATAFCRVAFRCADSEMDSTSEDSF